MKFSQRATFKSTYGLSTNMEKSWSSEFLFLQDLCIATPLFHQGIFLESNARRSYIILRTKKIGTRGRLSRGKIINKMREKQENVWKRRRVKVWKNLLRSAQVNFTISPSCNIVYLAVGKLFYCCDWVKKIQKKTCCWMVILNLQQACWDLERCSMTAFLY